MTNECPLITLLKKNKNNDFIVTQSKGTIVNHKLNLKCSATRQSQEVPDHFHEKSGLLCMNPMAGPRYGYNGGIFKILFYAIQVKLTDVP